MPIFFRILYTSGLRVSELRLAKIEDFHLDEGYFIVKSGKNNKDRIIPIHPVLVKKCKELKSTIHIDSDESEYFFMKLPGKPLTLHCVYNNFRRYLDKAGISEHRVIGSPISTQTLVTFPSSTFNSQVLIPASVSIFNVVLSVKP